MRKLHPDLYHQSSEVTNNWIFKKKKTLLYNYDLID
jgi:hypothetical protein